MLTLFNFSNWRRCDPSLLSEKEEELTSACTCWEKCPSSLDTLSSRGHYLWEQTLQDTVVPCRYMSVWWTPEKTLNLNANESQTGFSLTRLWVSSSHETNKNVVHFSWWEEREQVTCVFHSDLKELKESNHSMSLLKHETLTFLWWLYGVCLW